MPNRTGQQLGNYQLLRLLGEGGFAEVYLGEHIHLGTQAAIKVLRTQLAPEDLEDFRTEARTVAQLEHPNIVRVLEFGIEAGTPFLVMNYAPNGSLRQRHPKGVPVPLPTIVFYVRQLADALQYAHDEKVIHRDVKPENMLVGRRHEVLLSDFGIALLAQTSSYQSTQNAIGTVAYMAPEQIRGKPRPASDQYALGIVVYEWLCGYRPFSGSFTEVATQQMFEPPPPLREKNPTILPDIEQVVMTALAKEPPQRFANVQAFATALEQACFPVQHPPNVSPSQPLEPTVAATPSTQHVSPIVPVASLSQPPETTVISTPSLQGERMKPGVSRRAIITVLVLLALVVGASSLTWLLHWQQSLPPGTTPSPAQPSTSPTLDVQAASDWQDSGVFVSQGRPVTITYVSGYWRSWPGADWDGRGCTQGCDPVTANLIVGCDHGGLIGRIGSSQMICILNGTTVTATESGELYLRSNDSNTLYDNSGAITVRVTLG